MSLALANSRSPTGSSAAPPANGRVERPFASVEISTDFESVRSVWLELAAQCAMTPYQSPDFLQAWHETTGCKLGVKPMIVVARDENGRVSALFPFGRRRVAGLWIGAFLGGKEVNYNMPLVRNDLRVNSDAVAMTLRTLAKRPGSRIDAFALKNQPLSWRGEANVMAGKSNASSPSQGHKSALNGSYESWLAAHYSPDSLKKLRKKKLKLARLGPLQHCLAGDSHSRQAILTALERHKADQRALMGAGGAEREIPNSEFLVKAVERCNGAAGVTLELHALKCGESVVATFTGLAAGGGLYGHLISYDAAPEFARCSPGVLMVNALVASLFDRGFTTFDLGVGEARYKSEACEANEPLFDSAIGVTPAGRLWAVGYLAQQRLKRLVKRSPPLLALAYRVAGLKRRLSS